MNSRSLRNDSTEHESSSLTALIGRIEEVRASAGAMTHALGSAENDATESWNERLAKLQDDFAAFQNNIRFQGDELETQLAERALRLTQMGDEASGTLTERLAQLDTDLANKRATFTANTDDLSQGLDAIADRITTVSANIADLSDSGTVTHKQLADDVAALSGSIEESKALLETTRGDMDTVTDGSVRLLELLQAGVVQSQKVLPDALEQSEQRIAEIVASVTALATKLGEVDTTSISVSATVEDSHEKARAAIEYLQEWQERLGTSHADQRERLAELHTNLSDMGESLDGFTARSNTELHGVIAATRQAVDTALSDFEHSDSDRMQSLADNIGAASAGAIERVVKTRTVEAVESVETSAERARQSSQETLTVLQDQLAKVDELAAALENRVEHIRETATDQLDSDFSRRVAVITENLHSSSIDISKAMSEDVSETAWTAYLRGDRGIFTRRAVRLLDNTQAKEIAALYDSDGEFREHVSRYIHDFESLLRSLLATRDGNTLSVTILSSDMGKLYVALAQAIERLRS